jgi:hypothetical protein
MSEGTARGSDEEQRRGSHSLESKRWSIWAPPNDPCFDSLEWDACSCFAHRDRAYQVISDSGGGFQSRIACSRRRPVAVPLSEAEEKFGRLGIKTRLEGGSP